MFSVQATLLLLGVAVWLTAAPAAALTGCTCRGLIFSNSGRVGNYPPNTSFQVLYRQTGTGEAYYAKPNDGYCIKDNKLTTASLNNIAAGISANVDTNYVNITGTRVWCYTYQDLTRAECVSYAQQHEQQIILDNPSIIASCKYPTSNFVPTNCQCGFECTNGYVKCGASSCINPATQSCVSGSPVSRKAARRAMGLCPLGQTRCSVGLREGHECIDTQTNLESCGACLSEGGVDCSRLMGAALDVACVAGRCRSSACFKGYELMDGACIPGQANQTSGDYAAIGRRN